MVWKIILGIIGGIIGLILLIAPIWYAIQEIIDEIDLFSKRTKIYLAVFLFIIVLLYLLADGKYGIFTFLIITIAAPWFYGTGRWLLEEMDDSAMRIIGYLCYFKSGVLILLLVALPFFSLFSSDISLSEMWTGEYQKFNK